MLGQKCMYFTKCVGSPIMTAVKHEVIRSESVCSFLSCIIYTFRPSDSVENLDSYNKMRIGRCGIILTLIKLMKPSKNSCEKFY